MTERIAIIGGGISGLLMASLLQSDSSHRYEISLFERDAETLRVEKDHQGYQMGLYGKFGKAALEGIFPGILIYKKDGESSFPAEIPRGCLPALQCPTFFLSEVNKPMISIINDPKNPKASCAIHRGELLKALEERLVIQKNDIENNSSPPAAGAAGEEEKTLDIEQVSIMKKESSSTGNPLTMHWNSIVTNVEYNQANNSSSITLANEEVHANYHLVIAADRARSSATQGPALYQTNHLCVSGVYETSRFLSWFSSFSESKLIFQRGGGAFMVCGVGNSLFIWLEKKEKKIEGGAETQSPNEEEKETKENPEERKSDEGENWIISFQLTWEHSIEKHGNLLSKEQTIPLELFQLAQNHFKGIPTFWSPIIDEAVEKAEKQQKIHCRAWYSHDRLPEKNPPKQPRVVRIGDSWHAMTPFAAMGANMAIVDCKELGEILKKRKSTEDPDFTKSIKTFYKQAYSRNQSAVMKSRDNEESFNSSSSVTKWTRWCKLNLVGGIVNIIELMAKK